MKRLFSFGLVALLLATLCACGRAEAPTPTAAPTAAETTTVPSSDAPTTVGTTSGTAQTLISREEAKSAAFARAGVRADQVTRLQVELDYDDDRRRWEYELEFHVDHVEYTVEVSAETGEVVEFEKDYD